MRIIFFITVNFIMLRCSFGQQIINSQYDNHWNKSYINKNGEEVSVGVRDENYKSNKPKIRNFVVKNQSDLVLQKEYYESGKIKSIGYFRLIYDLKDENYRWIPDLIWTYYDEKETLKQQMIFLNGVIVKE